MINARAFSSPVWIAKYQFALGAENAFICSLTERWQITDTISNTPFPKADL